MPRSRKSSRSRYCFVSEMLFLERKRRARDIKPELMTLEAKESASLRARKKKVNLKRKKKAIKILKEKLEKSQPSMRPLSALDKRVNQQSFAVYLSSLPPP